MKTLSIFLTAACLFSAAAYGAEMGDTSDSSQLAERLRGRGVNCNAIEPGLTPTLNFETMSTAAGINRSGTILSLYFDTLYYRCLRGEDGDVQLSIVRPNDPYQYEVEQFDGTKTVVKVNSQQNRFSAMIKDPRATDITKGIPARVETDGLLYKIHLDLPINQLLSAKDLRALQHGNTIMTSVRVLSALSMDYRIGTQTQGDTGFIAGTKMTWELKLSKAQNQVKVVLVRVRTN
jgi:hypothetical protein